jgi:hypothetical protein
MSTLDRIEEIKIITPQISEENRRLLTQSIADMRNNIFLYYKIYGSDGIRIAVEKSGNLAKHLLDIFLLEVRDELSDLGVIVGIPNSYGVAYFPQNLQGGIERDEIVGKIKTYDGKNYSSSLIVIRNKISKKEEIYLSIKD